MKYEEHFGEIIKDILNVVKKSGNNVGITETANVKANTLVDSGTLRKSINYKVEENKENITVRIGVDGSFINTKNKHKVGDYAAKVEFKDKSYLRSTLKADESLIINTFKKGIKEAMK